VAGTAPPVGLLNINFGGVDAAGHRPVDVPEGPLLRVQHLPLQLVPLLGHLALRFSLEKIYILFIFDKLRVNISFTYMKNM